MTMMRAERSSLKCRIMVNRFPSLLGHTGARGAQVSGESERNSGSRCTSRSRIVRVTKFASSSARCSASLAACSRSSLTHISSILPSWSFFLRARAALPRIPPARLISWFCCDCEEAAAALSDSYR